MPPKSSAEVASLAFTPESVVRRPVVVLSGGAQAASASTVAAAATSAGMRVFLMCW